MKEYRTWIFEDGLFLLDFEGIEGVDGGVGVIFEAELA